MIWQFWAAIATALISSGVSPVAVPKILEWRNRKEKEKQAQAEQRQADEDQRLLRRKEAEEDRKNRERDTWMRDSKTAFDRVDRDCTICTRKLERMGNAFYHLLESLEDQVVPELDVPHRVTVRTIIHEARTAALAPILIPPIPDTQAGEQ